MKRFLSILLAVFVFVIFFEVAYYFTLYSKSGSTVESSNQSQVIPSTSTNNPAVDASAINKSLKILYQKPGDTEGRTIVYDKPTAWGGVGQQFFYPWLYEVGLFDHFEDIAGSSDRYLFLTDPLTQKPLAKILLAYQTNPLFPTIPKNPGVQAKNVQTTLFQVENLNNLVKNGGEMEQSGMISKYTSQQLNNVIEKGDALLVFLVNSYGEPSPTLDKNQNPIAFSLVIRRYEGAKNLGPF